MSEKAEVLFPNKVQTLWFRILEIQVNIKEEETCYC